jgi:hypothetical protein
LCPLRIEAGARVLDGEEGGGVSAYSDECALLMAMRVLLADRGAWTQRTAARDADNKIVDCWSDKARSWCLVGAAHALGYHEIIGDTLELIVAGDYGNFNDTHTHAEVLAALDRAIEASP